MQLTRCDQGHYYDPTKHSGCPHCGIKIDFDFLPSTPASAGSAAGTGADDRTVLMNNAPGTPVAPNDGGAAARQEDRTMAFNQASTPGASSAHPVASENRTIGMFRKKLGIEPVVGWLVCIEGADRGRDYRIISEKNFIGRSEKMDISIAGDETISRDGHAIISYNPKKNVFRIYPGESRGIVYLNEEEVTSATELNAYDLIEIGQSKLLFIPFCGEKFQWLQS